MAQMFLDPHLGKHCKKSQSPSCRILGTYFSLLGVDFLAPCGTASVLFPPVFIDSMGAIQLFWHCRPTGRFPRLPGMAPPGPLLSCTPMVKVPWCGLQLHARSLTARPWKMMVAKLLFLLGFGHFSRAMLNFRWVDLFASWLTSSFE